MAMFFLVLEMLCMVAPTLQGTTYAVGEDLGWNVGVDYKAWAKSNHFKVGDSLAFSYPSGHTVDEVFENDYKTCNTGHPISSDHSGSTIIGLYSAGPHYFMCGKPGYCVRGMKLAVNVTPNSNALLGPFHG